jgi:hypothetical protein
VAREPTQLITTTTVDTDCFMSLPLFTTISALHTISPSTHFVLVRGGKAFPIASKHLHRFRYLDELFRVQSEDDQNDLMSSSELRQVEVAQELFTDDAVAVVAGYCRLPTYTPSADIPRDVDRFLECITDAERTFLSNVLAPPTPEQGGTTLQFSFEALKLAEFLQCDDLMALLCGFVATRLNGKTTEQMRLLLAIPAGTPEEHLFTEETLYMLRAEDSWNE